MRQQHPVGHISGPYVAGQGLEFDPVSGLLYVAAYHKPDTLQCFDLTARKLLWTMYDEANPCALYDVEVSARRGLWLF